MGSPARRVVIGIFLLIPLFLVCFATSGQALELCAKADVRGPDPTAPKNNSPIKLRTACKPGKEVSLGTTEDLAKVQANEAAIANKADQSEVEANTAAIGQNTAAIAEKADQSAVDANTSAIAGKAGHADLDALALAVAGFDADIGENFNDIAINSARIEALEIIHPGCLADPAPEWLRKGDGTAIQCSTGLMWELKTDDGSIHDKDNTYSWSGPTYGVGNSNNYDGTVVTVFLESLNSPPCFAGYCDWRLPTMAGHPSQPTGEAPELESVLLQPFVCGTSPCTTIPGNTAPYYYWSSTESIDESYPEDSRVAYRVNFDNGNIVAGTKNAMLYVRAVRDPS